MRGTRYQAYDKTLGIGDHPRACGEHWLSKSRHAALTGSSPRMRGTQIDTLFHVPFIWDHPRACGEHYRKRRFPDCRVGSSPRMRGTPVNALRLAKIGGIIPAHAGNTALSDSRRKTSRDHPRACGEHPSLVSKMMVCGGSSPRMRGTPPALVPNVCFVGIIPAHAGNTVGCTVHNSTFRDHPRACGEHPSGQVFAF